VVSSVDSALPLFFSYAFSHAETREKGIVGALYWDPYWVPDGLFAGKKELCLPKNWG